MVFNPGRSDGNSELDNADMYRTVGGNVPVCVCLCVCVCVAIYNKKNSHVYKTSVQITLVR